MQPLHRRFTRSHAYPYLLLVGRKGIAALPNGHFHTSPCLALPASEGGSTYSRKIHNSLLVHVPRYTSAPWGWGAEGELATASSLLSCLLIALSLGLQFYDLLVAGGEVGRGPKPPPHPRWPPLAPAGPCWPLLPHPPPAATPARKRKK